MPKSLAYTKSVDMDGADLLHLLKLTVYIQRSNNDMTNTTTLAFSSFTLSCKGNKHAATIEKYVNG